MASIQGLRSLKFYSFMRGGERLIFLSPSGTEFGDVESVTQDDVELIISDEGFDRYFKENLLGFEC